MSGSVGADHHGETISKGPDPDRVPLVVKDVFSLETVLEGRRGNDRLIRHGSKITCGFFRGQELVDRKSRGGDRSQLLGIGDASRRYLGGLSGAPAVNATQSTSSTLTEIHSSVSALPLVTVV